MDRSHARNLASALVASFAMISAFPSLCEAQQVTTLEPVPVEALAPVQVAPMPYQPAMESYAPSDRPVRLRRTVTPYEGGPIPEGAQRSTRANVAMIAGGAATLGVGYVAAVVGWFGSISCYGFFECRSASGWLFVPLVGPWLALTDRSPDTTATALYVADGLAQVGGLALMIAGAALRHDVLVTTSLADNRRARTPSASWNIAPVTGNGQHGLAVFGSF